MNKLTAFFADAHNRPTVIYAVFGGILALVLFFFLFPKCRVCGTRKFRFLVMRGTKKMDWLHPNIRPFQDGRVCAHGDCDTQMAIYESKYNDALNKAHHLKVFTDTYKGRTGEVPGTRRDGFSTEYFRERDDALFMLKATAAFMYKDIDTLVNVAYHKDTGSEGNYRYTIWRAVGAPCRSSK